MRVSIVSILLAGGILTLGACASADPSPMTLADRTDQCQRIRAETVPTGRQTGDARQDYRCRSRHASVTREGRVPYDGTRNAAVDRALKSGK